MSKNIANELLRLKQEIETGKIKKAKLEGELESIKKELKAQHKCKTLGEAKKKLAKLEETRSKAEAKLDKATNALVKKYDLRV